MAEPMQHSVVDVPPQMAQQPMRPSWNPAEEARRRAELEAAAVAQMQSKRKRGKQLPMPVPDLTATAQIARIADALPSRNHASAGEFHAVFVPRAICVTGFFLLFAFPAALLYLNHLGHADLVNGRFEPDEFARRISIVMLAGGALCMLLGWLWWGVAAALNARHQARWAVSPWYVPASYVGVADLAYGATVAPTYVGELGIYVRACASALALMMYFSTLSTYRRTAQSVGASTSYFTRLIVTPWVVAVVGGVLAWFWKYLPPQAMLGALVATQLVAGLYGLTMYQAMASLDRACSGTRMLRHEDQEFAKFLKVVG
jgi:hypothetical protein